MPQQNNIIAANIIASLQDGEPVSFYDYMRYCLLDSKVGIYGSGAPIGEVGDFTTAPEISQIFGECIGFWLLDLWHRSGKPQQLTLIELGSGRGVLLRDILSLLHEQMPIHAVAVDINAHFRNMQKNILQKFNKQVTFINNLKDAKNHCKGLVAIIANEFLDTLPVRQFMWDFCEKSKKLNLYESFLRKENDNKKNDNIVFYRQKSHAEIPAYCLPESAPEAGDMFEFAPDLKPLMQNIAELAHAALLIDYGYAEPAYGSSAQAVQNHSYATLPSTLAELQSPHKIPDISAHVNFKAAAILARKFGFKHTHLLTQQEFLGSMGGAIRLQKLCRKTQTEQQKNILTQAYERISDPNDMGTLCKALMLYK